MNEKTYKLRFGFDLKKGICSLESANKTRIKTLQNYDTVIKQNLTIKGAESRFKKGDKGRTKDKVSPQTRIMLKERLKTPEMIKKMKLSGYNVGKSGLGNKKKWSKEDKKDE